MGVTTAVRARAPRSEAERWSFAALALAVIGLALATWVILGSDGDSSHVRWWLVVAPLFVTAIPVLLPRHGIRLGAVIALGAWCVLGLASIGMLLVPALVATVVAVVRERE